MHELKRSFVHCAPRASARQRQAPAKTEPAPQEFTLERRAEVEPRAVVSLCVNEGDVAPLARYAREHGLEMRYIEYMPIGAEAWERGKVYFAHEILDVLEREVGALLPAEDYDPRAPAMEFRYADGGGRVGIIASV